MNTLSLNQNYTEPAIRHSSENVLSRFLSWTKSEEKNRIAWLGISITMMTAIFFPVTMLSVLLHSGSFKLIIGAMVSLILVVIPNLAALPTRYTIPAFFTGISIDIFLIALSFFI
jgi:hypothetical protein